MATAASRHVTTRATTPGEIDRNGLEVLDRAACLELLGRCTLGRLGITSDALPTVLPVNFVLDDDRIVVSTAQGSKLDAAVCNAVVAFEVDDFDPVDHSGWSVVVTGVARPVSDAAEVAQLSRLPLARWAPAGEAHFITIDTEYISGRRISTLATAAANRRAQ